MMVCVQRPALQLPPRRVAQQSAKMATISRAEGGQLQAPVRPQPRSRLSSCELSALLYPWRPIDVRKHLIQKPMRIGAAVASFGLPQTGRQGGHAPAIRLVGRPVGVAHFCDLLAFAKRAYVFHSLTYIRKHGLICPCPKPGIGTGGN